MPDTKIDVSIIVVSYNTALLTRNCLESVYKHVRCSNEIIVVDNASTDNSLKFLRDLNDKKKIRLIELDKNLGFGSSNNRGAAVAKGKYLLFLNSDTLLTHDAVTPALKFALSHTRLGGYTPALRHVDGSLQATGGSFPTLFSLLTWQFFLDDLPLIGQYFKSIHPHEPGFLFLHRFFPRLPKSGNRSIYDKPGRPDWITGAFMFIPKAVFEKVGGFDEKIFLYTEELELCYRIKKLGYVFVYEPGNSIVHLVGRSGGSKLATYLEIKYMQYFFEKHQSRLQSTISKHILRLGCLLRLFIFGIIKRNDVAKEAYIKAFRILT